ncbi:peptidase M75 [Mycolicibacterium porcinum]|nr:peptidase M75 [Mycolicibacterium porcinum]
MAHAAHTSPAGLIATVILTGLTGVSMSGCAPKPSIDEGSPVNNEITVAATDDFCQLSRTTAGIGDSTFVITNNGTLVTEFYVYGAGDRVMGAVENISPGLQRKLTVQLSQPGRYYTACKPGMIGDGIRADFTVKGNAVPLDIQGKFNEAAELYKNYVTNQTANLVAATEEFIGTIKKGDVQGAQALYPKARTYYGRVKPVAESLPDNLDQRIDQRETELRPGADWTGFHRLEKDLWVTRPLPDLDAIADQLLSDVRELDAAVKDPKWTTDATGIVGGAQDLLDELTRSTLTGDEDIFSHTDLWDFQAKLDGSRSAIGSVRPIIDERDPDLGRRIDQAFATAQGLLDSHHWNDGFVYYDSVTAPEREELSRAIDALGVVVRQVQDVVAQR